MTLQKAIFDMDGTILDSTAMWRNAAAHVVTALGHSPKESIGRDTLALGMLEFAPFLKKDYDLPQPVEEIHAILEQRVQQYYTKEAELKPGALAFLRMLKDRGVTLVLATATERRLLLPALALTGADVLFDEIYTCGEVGHSKHTPEIYRAALSSTPKDAAWIFEDACYAIHTAVNDGFQVCAVADPATVHQWDEITATAACTLEDYRRWQQLPFLR